LTLLISCSQSSCFALVWDVFVSEGTKDESEEMAFDETDF